MNKYKYVPVDNLLTEDAVDDEIIIEPGDFPIDVFPKDLQLFFNEVGKTMGFHKDILALSYLSLISTIIGNKYKLRVKNGWDCTSTLWICIVGNSGVAKSPPMKFIWKPLREKIDKIELENYLKNKETYEEYLQKPVKERKLDPLSPPTFTQNILTDTTLEGLYIAWNNNNVGLCMMREELKGWLLAMNAYRKGSDEQTWLEFADNTTTTVNRATKDPLYIENPCINVLGAIQPNVLNDFNSDNGMFQRILFSNEIKDINSLNMLEIDENKIKWYEEHIITSYKLIRSLDPSIIIMGNDSKEIYNKYDEDYILPMMRSESTSDVFRGTLSKMRIFIPRIALNLFIIDVLFKEAKEFNAKHIEKSLKVAEYFIDSNRYLTGVNEKMKEMGNIINNKGKKRVDTIKDLIEAGFTQMEISKKLKICRRTINNDLKKLKDDKFNK